MMYIISKTEDDVEFLPDITDTPIWADYDTFQCNHSVKCIAMLYSAISKRENYYQFNTPSAFGDPQYKYYCGVVDGILQASGMEEIICDNIIIIKKNNTKKLIIDKMKRTQSYINHIKDNNNVLQSVLG